MLTKLSIKNYALINQLSIDFSAGLSIITGETGAGKSILLGALGLVLGNRADSSSLKNSKEKCVVEASMSIKNYALHDFFAQVDLDYDEHTIIRREILPSGKSRAFVNDTPVTLAVLNQLKLKLIDVHSQHQTMQLSNADFQFTVLDALAKNQSNLQAYKKELQQYHVLQNDLVLLQENQREANRQYDYNLHLFTELEEAKLKENEQEDLEEVVDKLNNIEEIKLGLSEAIEISTHEEIGLQNRLTGLQFKLEKIASFSKEYEELLSRISSVKIELDDIVTELEDATENVDFNPAETQKLNDRLQLIYNLQKKHSVDTVAELLAIYEELSEKIDQVENAEEIINNKKAAIDEIANNIDKIADKISKSRKEVIPNLSKELERLLVDLGIENARFSIAVNPTKNYFANGKDHLDFLFSANKGTEFGELKKVASGGELSRIMLSIKKVLSENTHLPTIIFDEIDTGVSGEVSNKIAFIMEQMSNNMQVIAITHLPQIASKGKNHYKVFKEEVNGITTTNLKQLSVDDRIKEIAEMLSGKDISDSALTHAKQLLN